MERTKMPNLRNGSKGRIRNRTHLIASLAFYRGATALHNAYKDIMPSAEQDTKTFFPVWQYAPFSPTPASRVSSAHVWHGSLYFWVVIQAIVLTRLQILFLHACPKKAILLMKIWARRLRLIWSLSNISWLPGFARAPPSLPASLSLSPSLSPPSRPPLPLSILGGGDKLFYRFCRQFMKFPGLLIFFTPLNTSTPSHRGFKKKNVLFWFSGQFMTFPGLLWFFDPPKTSTTPHRFFFKEMFFDFLGSLWHFPDFWFLDTLKTPKGPGVGQIVFSWEWVPYLPEYVCQIWLRSDGRVEKKRGGYRQTDRQRETAALYSRCSCLSFSPPNLSAAFFGRTTFLSCSVCNDWPYERFHQYHLEFFSKFSIFPNCIQFHGSFPYPSFSCVDVFWAAARICLDGANIFKVQEAYYVCCK